MLQAIREANPGSPFMYVVDTRPKVSSCGLWLLLKLASLLARLFPVNFHNSANAFSGSFRLNCVSLKR